MHGLPAFETLDLEIADGWLTAWFNTPENRNALSTQRVEELHSLCDWLQDAPQIRGLVLRGRGGVFCAGGDLKAFQTIFSEGGEARPEIIELSIAMGKLLDAFRAVPHFTIVAVEGAAMAGGFGLTCVGDHVVATRDALFGLSETRIGLTPAQIAPFVVQRLGYTRGRKLMMLGSRFDGEEAQRIGLTDAVVADAAGLEAEIAAMQKAVSKAAPQALAAVKSQIEDMQNQPRAQQIAAAAEGFADRLLSDEAREGIMSFMQKRSPNWAE
jgi:isohexenylglutaconyl-CoA hydratase